MAVEEKGYDNADNKDGSEGTGECLPAHSSRSFDVEVRDAENKRENGHGGDGGVEDGFHDYFSFPKLMITPEASPFAAAL